MKLLGEETRTAKSVNAEGKFILHNGTLLLSFLSHLQAVQRKIARLQFEAVNHPQATEETRRRHARPQEEARECWEILRKDLWALFELQLVPFSELVSARFPYYEKPQRRRNPLRMTMAQIKAEADKARTRGRDIQILRSWDLATHETPPDLLEEAELARYGL